MLKSECINPLIMKSLSLCGHGDKVLVVDGNYPMESTSGNAERIFLGLTKGVPTATQVVEILTKVTNFEKAEIMVPVDGGRPEIFGDFTALLKDAEIAPLDRFSFYDAACQPNVRFAISTGEARFYGCILLTVGVC